MWRQNPLRQALSAAPDPWRDPLPHARRRHAPSPCGRQSPHPRGPHPG
nr:MAG TPA: hypothetical protein [Caudoviricetes sp.]